MEGPPEESMDGEGGDFQKVAQLDSDDWVVKEKKMRRQACHQGPGGGVHVLWTLAVWGLYFCLCFSKSHCFSWNSRFTYGNNNKKESI